MLQRSRLNRSPVRLVILIMLMTCALGLAVFWQRAREECHTTACRGKLFEIGVLLQNYQAVHGTYPASSDEAKAGIPAVSWRVLALVPVDSRLGGYNLAEGWDSPQNERFISNPLGNAFYCPAASDAAAAGRTSYLAIVGEGSLWSEVRLGHIRSPDKDAPQKILVIEVPESDIAWTEPRDLSVEDAIALFRSEHGIKGGRHGRGLHYLAADGSVHSFAEVGSVEDFSRLLRAAN